MKFRKRTSLEDDIGYKVKRKSKTEEIRQSFVLQFPDKKFSVFDNEFRDFFRRKKQQKKGA